VHNLVYTLVQGLDVGVCEAQLVLSKHWGKVWYRMTVTIEYKRVLSSCCDNSTIYSRRVV
jgi:hypothetical protein